MRFSAIVFMAFLFGGVQAARAYSNDCREGETSGIVLLSKVCGKDNILIKSDDNWYITFDNSSILEFAIDEKVCGDFNHYGMVNIIKNDGKKARVYLDNKYTSFETAAKSLCK
jgi:hypothetical protein